MTIKKRSAMPKPPMKRMNKVEKGPNVFRAYVSNKLSADRPEFKLVLTALGVMCSILLLTACSRMYVSEDNNPDVAWKEFCGYISDGDLRAAVEMTGNTIDVSRSDIDGSVEGLMLNRLHEYFRAEAVAEPMVNGVRAWQSVKIERLDVALVMKKALAGVMSETWDYEWKHGSYKSDGDIAAAVKDSMRNQLLGDLNDCTVSDVIKVEFRYKNGRWAPVMTDSLYRTITGDAAGASDCVAEFFKEYDDHKTVNSISSGELARSDDPSGAD